MKNGDICKYVLRGYECLFIGKLDDVFSVVSSEEHGVETLTTVNLVPVGNNNWKEELQTFMNEHCSDYMSAPYFDITEDSVVIDGVISIENFKKMCSIVRGN